MNLAPKKGGLGRGLESLFSDNSSDVQSKRTLRVSEIEPNRMQPRKDFDEESIASLSESIKDHGVLQPLVVRPYGSSYQIVAGERRWRAAKNAGISEVPVVIKDLSDSETMQIALIENLQRENLNPVEEALSYRDLSDTYGMTQEEIARITGRSRSAVANSLRILGLPEEVLEMIKAGSVSTGHAKVLLSVEDEDTVRALAQKISEEGMSVRVLEETVKSLNSEKKKNAVKKLPDSYFKEMELSLREVLGRKVSVKCTGSGKGTIVLEFFDRDDLSALADKLAGQ